MKLCLYCANSGRVVDECWSGDVPQNGFHCHKGHFSAYGAGRDRELNSNAKVIELLERAETCPDYAGKP